MKRLWSNLDPVSIEKIISGLEEEGWKLQNERHITCSLVDCNTLVRDTYIVTYEVDYNQRVLGMETLLVPSELISQKEGEYILYVRPRTLKSE